MISADSYKIICNYESQKNVIKYAIKKLKKINRFLVKKNNADFKYVFYLNEVDESHNNKYKVILEIAGNENTISYSAKAMNIMAAMDIVEEKVLIS